MPRWYVYLVRCRNGSLYTGITTDVAARVKAHNAGTGAKYTRAFGPVALVYKKVMRSATAARRWEAEIKHWDKRRKERMLEVYEKSLQKRLNPRWTPLGGRVGRIGSYEERKGID